MMETTTSKTRLELDQARSLLARLKNEVHALELPTSTTHRIDAIMDDMHGRLMRLTFAEVEKSLGGLEWRPEWKRKKAKAPRCGALRADGKPCEARALPGRTGCKWHGQEIEP